MLRVVVLAPIGTSLYSRTVAHMVEREPGMHVTAVIVRTPWSLDRIRAEFRRDGPRLVHKVHRKLVLREQGANGGDSQTLLSVSNMIGVPDCSLYGLGAQYGIAVHTVRDHNDEHALKVIRAAMPDVIAFTGGGLIRDRLLGIPSLGVLNCHMGVLPAYRGMDVVEWPLVDAGGAGSNPTLGLTVHFMDAGVDTGDVLLSRKMDLEPIDSLVAIRRRLEGLMPGVMLEALRGLRDGTIRRQPQEIHDGRQFFVMHPRVERCAAARLAALVGWPPGAGVNAG